ncbi:MAG: hypothetical protein FWF78_03100 [Defluviitaleaceae bacterium]|nr:hypothetical protein [Defluviitaleaceae bacterium]
MKIKSATLDAMILSAVKKQAEVVFNINCLSELQEIGLGQMQIADHENRIRQLTEQIHGYYEQYVMGQISRETYTASKDGCAKEIEKRESRINTLKQFECDNLKNHEMAALIKDASGVTESNAQRSIIKAVVEKILVLPKNQIKIVWKFEDFGISV